MPNDQTQLQWAAKRRAVSFSALLERHLQN